MFCIAKDKPPFPVSPEAYVTFIRFYRKCPKTTGISFRGHNCPLAITIAVSQCLLDIVSGQGVCHITFCLVTPKKINHKPFSQTLILIKCNALDNASQKVLQISAIK